MPPWLGHRHCQAQDLLHGDAGLKHASDTRIGRLRMDFVQNQETCGFNRGRYII